MVPNDQLSGSAVNALLSLVASLSSPTILLSTATLPLSRPPMQRAAISPRNDVLNPNRRRENVTPVSPMRRTGLRPILSLTRPHATTDRNVENANAASIVPA